MRAIGIARVCSKQSLDRFDRKVGLSGFDLRKSVE